MNIITIITVIFAFCLFLFSLLFAIVGAPTAEQNCTSLSCSVPTSVGSSLRADVPHAKKKHRRMKSTSRGSDPCVDAGAVSVYFVNLKNLMILLFCKFVHIWGNYEHRILLLLCCGYV